ARRTMALLADNDFGLAVHELHLGLPLEMLLGTHSRLFVLEVILLAEHEQHDVGVLLDRTGLTQIGQLRALVIAAFNLTRELRERQNRNIKLLSQRLEPSGDLGHFLHAALLRAVARS